MPSISELDSTPSLYKAVSHALSTLPLHSRQSQFGYSSYGVCMPIVGRPVKVLSTELAVQ